VHGCVGPLGNSTNWNAIAGWVKYHEERWGLTHVDIFVFDEELHVAQDSFDAVGLETSNVALNFTLYSANTTTTANGEAWLAKECRANAIVGKRDFLIEFMLDHFLVSDSFDSLQDIFNHTKYPDAVVFPTYTNHYEICSSKTMTFASATFVDHMFPSFVRFPILCPGQKRCHMSDGVTRYFMYPSSNGDEEAGGDPKDTHLIRFANKSIKDKAKAGLHKDLSTQGCRLISNCTNIKENRGCTDMNEIALYEHQVTSINSILSDLALTPGMGELKRHAVCYAQLYPDLFAGFCHGEVAKCNYRSLYDHYVQHGSAVGLRWECGLDEPLHTLASDAAPKSKL
jgi:hypothetical protein